MRRRARKKRWKDLSGGQRGALLGALGVQVALLVAALADLRRRPAAEVNGPKALWGAVSLVNFVGPIAYFLLGRRRSTPPR